jgi:hypothetical protein
MELSAIQSTQAQEEEDKYLDTEPFDNDNWDRIIKIQNSNPEEELEKLLRIRNNNPDKRYQPFLNRENHYILFRVVTLKRTYE